MAKDNENCASCPHLAVDRDGRGWPKPGAVGYCRLREFSVEDLVATVCANHPDRNVLGFEAVVGPVWIADLPVVHGLLPIVEDGAGGICSSCERHAPGPKHILWTQADERVVLCSRECYVEWAQSRDPSIPAREKVVPEDLAELRRLHRGLCEAETALLGGDVGPLVRLPELLRFTGGPLYRVLYGRQMLPKRGLENHWPELFRGGPKHTREIIHPGVLEVQLALREILSEPPCAIPAEASERAYEYARVRWARMVLGDLTELREGPAVPKEVDKRFRGRHRPMWREGETENPMNARRAFYLERNPDLEAGLREYFGAIQSTE